MAEGACKSCVIWLRCARGSDFRAWYGLGQTYEILQMHSYSLFYFSKAAALRPYDPRMWCAMAESYERLHRIDDAIKCYLRAEGNGDGEGQALFKLAKLHAQLTGSANQQKVRHSLTHSLTHIHTHTQT